jgi:hypothetical protein
MAAACILPKRDMLDPPAWHPDLYARCHLVQNVFAQLKDFTRPTLRPDKIRLGLMSSRSF